MNDDEWWWIMNEDDDALWLMYDWCRKNNIQPVTVWNMFRPTGDLLPSCRLTDSQNHQNRIVNVDTYVFPHRNSYTEKPGSLCTQQFTCMYIYIHIIFIYILYLYTYYIYIHIIYIYYVYTYIMYILCIMCMYTYGDWSKFLYLQTAILREHFFCESFANSMFIFCGTHVEQQLLLWRFLHHLPSHTKLSRITSS